MTKQKKKQKGLSDSELVEKYEGGKIDLKKPMKKMLKTPSKSAILREQNKK